jgi:hypothetical protein
MSETAGGPEMQPGGNAAGGATRRQGLGVETLAFGGLVALTIVGVAIADFSAGEGLWFWLLLIPVYAAFNIATGWTRARARGEGGARLVWKRVAHWLALLPAFYLVYALQQTGRIDREDAGLVALTALALTTLLAGVHFDWRLGMLGLLLGVTAGAAALVEEFFWVVLFATLVAAAIAFFWHRRGD